jgi:hypothetical protein
MPLPVKEEVTFTLAAQLGGTVNAVALEGNIVYAGIGPRLVTVDISDPAAPRFLGQSDILPAVVDAVAVGDEGAANVAYVAAGGDLYLYGVSEPATPVRISTLGALVDPAELFRVNLIPAGDVVYAVNQLSQGMRSLISLVALDVSNPAQPVVIGMRDLPPSAAVTLIGDVLYIANEGKLQLVEAGSLDKTLGELEIETELSDAYWRYDVTVVGDLAYIGFGDQRLLVLDVSNPAQPEEVDASQIDLPLGVTGITATDEALFLVDSLNTGYCSSLLRVIDTSDASSPRPAAELDPHSCINDLAVTSSTLVAASGNKGLQIFDASDPDNLVLTGEFVHPAGFTDVEILDLNPDVAYIISGDPTLGERATLHVLDRTQPAAPGLTGDPLDLDLPPGYPIIGFYARGNRLYVVGVFSLLLLDTSEPPASIRLGI